jgi:hypothetical protein
MGGRVSGGLWEKLSAAEELKKSRVLVGLTGLPSARPTAGASEGSGISEDEESRESDGSAAEVSGGLRAAETLLGLTGLRAAEALRGRGLRAAEASDESQESGGIPHEIWVYSSTPPINMVFLFNIVGGVLS